MNEGCLDDSFWQLEMVNPDVLSRGFRDIDDESERQLIRARRVEDDRHSDEVDDGSLSEALTGPLMKIDFACVHETRSYDSRFIQDSHTLLFKEVPVGCETGGVLWAACIVFCVWILQNHGRFQNKHVLELGSGLGLAGLTTARFASEVTLSDYLPTLLRNLQCHIQLNLQQDLGQEKQGPQDEKMQPTAPGYQRVRTEKLDWSSFTALPSHNIVIGSELCYSTEHTEHLAAVIRSACCNHNATCYLFHYKNRPGFGKLKEMLLTGAGDNKNGRTGGLRLSLRVEAVELDEETIRLASKVLAGTRRVNGSDEDDNNNNYDDDDNGSGDGDYDADDGVGGGAGGADGGNDGDSGDGGVGIGGGGGGVVDDGNGVSDRDIDGYSDGGAADDGDVESGGDCCTALPLSSCSTTGSKRSRSRRRKTAHGHGQTATRVTPLTGAAASDFELTLISVK